MKVIGLGPTGLAKQAVQVLAPVAGTQVRPGSRVYLGGAEVAWDFSSTSSSGASLAIGYRDYRSLAPAVALPSGREIEGLTGRYLAITNGNGVHPTVRDLVTGAIIHLALRDVPLGRRRRGRLDRSRRPAEDRAAAELTCRRGRALTCGVAVTGAKSGGDGR